MKRIFAISFVFCIILSCQKEETKQATTPANNTPATYYLSCKLNGNTYSADSAWGSTMGGTNIFAKMNDATKGNFEINLNSSTIGQHNLPPTGTEAVTYYITGTSINGTWVGDSGVVNVTAYDAITNIIEGTFLCSAKKLNGTSTTSTFNLTEGKFKVKLQ